MVDAGRHNQCDRLAPLRARDRHGDRVRVARQLAYRAFDVVERDLQSARDDHTVAASGDRKSSFGEDARVAGTVPADRVAGAERGVGALDIRREVLVEVALGEHGARQFDLPVDDLGPNPGERDAVVHASTAGLAGTVGADDAEPEVGRRRHEFCRDRLAAHQNAVEAAKHFYIGG